MERRQCRELGSTGPPQSAHANGNETVPEGRGMNGGRIWVAVTPALSRKVRADRHASQRGSQSE